MNSRFVCIVYVLFITLFSLSAFAKQPVPAISPNGFPALDQYRATCVAIYTDDFGGLKPYREAAAALGPPAANENRVIFIGDSITDYWKLTDYFSGKPYINRAIDGQITPQMLVRFRQDVIDLDPKVLVVLAGTNDIAGATGPARNEDIEANYASMAELAQVHRHSSGLCVAAPGAQLYRGCKRVVCAAPAGTDLGSQCVAQGLLAKNGFVYLDYFSALADEGEC